jgi:hypothetical protein
MVAPENQPESKTPLSLRQHYLDQVQWVSGVSAPDSQPWPLLAGWLPDLKEI